MIAHLLDWLIAGTNDTRLSDEWLASKMPSHDLWTRSQQQPGLAVIVADVKATQRKAFWERQASKRQAGPKVVSIGRHRG